MEFPPAHRLQDRLTMVAMSKKARIDPNTTLAALVLDHPEATRVLRDLRLDYCCAGELTLDAACRAKRLEPEAVICAIAAAITEADERHAFVDARRLSTAALVRHIVERHHRYLRKTLPYVAELAAKVSRVHGEHNPKLRPLATAVVELVRSLEPHLDEEEQKLFVILSAPSVGRLARDEEVLARELAAMREEHAEVGEVLARIRALADDYVTPDWACRSYHALFDGLAELERDTFEHIHLENHVLAPRFAVHGHGSAA